MDDQALRVSQPIDDFSGRRCFIGFERIVSGDCGHLRQYSDGGIAVDEHLSDVVVCIETVDEVELVTSRLRKRSKRSLETSAFSPSAVGIHVMGLDIEDEFIAFERRAGPGVLQHARVHVESGATAVRAAVDLIDDPER